MKFYMTLIIATLGVGLVTGAAFAQDKINYTEMVEDLKVMCRIIDETMDETFENDYVKGGFFRKGGCQHLYLKDYGAVFLLDVQFPVAEKEIRAVKTKKKTNMWEKYEREVRHQNQLEEQNQLEKTVWVTDKTKSYSKEKVDKLKEQLAYLVGEYGSRISQLGFDDTISFVVFGYSGHGTDISVNWEIKWHEQEALEGTKDTLQEIVEEAEQILEAKQKLEGIAEQESRDDDEKAISQKGKTIIIKEEKDGEMEDSEPKKGKRPRMLIPPIPPIPPSFYHRFRDKPATTLILTFKRSQLEGQKGADWEALLTAAEVVEY